MKKPLIISGLPEGDSGVGRLIEYLKEKNDNNFSMISVNINFKNSSKNKFNKFILKIINKIVKLCYKFLIKTKLRFIKGRKIILIHPQSIGFNTALKLIKNNKIFYYVMDNSFFCIRSYNYIPKERTSCFRCIEKGYNQIKKNKCNPFPRGKLKNNLKFLNRLEENKKQIYFLVQNENQKKIVMKHFNDVKCEVIGLRTSDMTIPQEGTFKKPITDYDIVYHAASHSAKGILFVLKMSKYLKEYKLLIPDSMKNINERLNVKLNKKDFSNVCFKKMRWDTGLKKNVMGAKIVLNPSLWSTPIEGALIKSLAYNGMVASFNLSYSFPSEIPDEVLLKMDKISFKNSSNILREILENKEIRKQYRKKAKEWIKKFIKSDSMYEELKKIIFYKKINLK